MADGARIISVLFLTRKLGYGGAERQLIELVRRIDKTRFRVAVATFYDGGKMRSEMESIEGIRLIALAKRGRYDLAGFLSRLIGVVRDFRPDVIQTQSASSLFALIAGKYCRCRVILGIRNADMDWSLYGWLEPLLFRLNAHLARHADLLIANSFAGKEHYAGNGYPEDRLVVVHNGFDTARFFPAPERGKPIRQEWGVSPEEFLIGIVGRLDVMKDHRTFLRAAALICPRYPAARFVCVGDGFPGYCSSLRDLAASLGIGGRVIWAGARTDMPAVYNALDICASTSAFGEGVSNAIGEAIACGVPCTVTDVGDAALLVGDSRRVALPGQPERIADCWSRLLDMPEDERRRLGLEGRQRIEKEFSLDLMAHSTEALLSAVVSGNLHAADSNSATDPRGQGLR